MIHVNAPVSKSCNLLSEFAAWGYEVNNGDTVFNAELLKRYDVAGPRYTSYPTAVQFHTAYKAEQYQAEVRKQLTSKQISPLSLYVHIPFCDTVCYYCACNKVITKNKARAFPYLQRLYKEIAMQSKLHGKQRPITQLHFGGGTPTFLSDDELTELIEQLREHFNFLPDQQAEYSIEIDPRGVGSKRIKLLRKLGFNRLSCGVQDFEPKVQAAVNRIQSEAETLEVITSARECGFKSISLDLIYGLPHQNRESFARTIDKVIDMRPDRISVFNYAHMPQLFKTQRQIDSRHLPSAEEKLAILKLSIDRLCAAGYKYIGMDHFALPDDELALAQQNGSLQRNFQGYSTQADCDLVALGASAIGKLDNCYVQNEKDLANYYSRIDNGELPIFRGYRLDDDDQLRRDVITQLICQFELEWQNIAAKWQIEPMDYFSAERLQLEPLQADGLLSMNAQGIKVLPAGRLLIRNICMVFDKFLAAPEIQQRYSSTV